MKKEIKDVCDKHKNPDCMECWYTTSAVLLTCDCISYNQPETYQKTKSVILRPPFSDKPAEGPEVPHKEVSIDARITEVIKHLWANGIYTLNSCCGHNKENPSVILGNNRKDGEKIREKIKEVDTRNWDLLSWTLTKI